MQVLTASHEEGPQGPLLKELDEIAPEAYAARVRIHCPSLENCTNAFADAARAQRVTVAMRVILRRDIPGYLFNHPGCCTT